MEGVDIGDGVKIRGYLGWPGQWSRAFTLPQYEIIDEGEGASWGDSGILRWEEGAWVSGVEQCLSWWNYGIFSDVEGTYKLYAKETYGEVTVDVGGESQTTTCLGTPILVWEGYLTAGTEYTFSVTIKGTTNKLCGVTLVGVSDASSSSSSSSSSSDSSSRGPLTIRVITDVRPSKAVGGYAECTCYDVVLCYKDETTGKVLPYPYVPSVYGRTWVHKDVTRVSNCNDRLGEEITDG